MTKLTRIFSVFLILGLIQGCASFRSEEAEPKRYNEPRFTEQQPIELKVNKINIVSEFTPSFTRPNVEHLFPISIEKTAKLWAKDRLEAVDYASDKQADFIIRNASVTEEVEKAEQFLYKDRVKYRATLNVVLKISDPNKSTNAETEIEAWRELIIPIDTDIAEKEKYWDSMVQKLFEEFNRQMENNIHQYLNMYVANNQIIQEYN